MFLRTMNDEQKRLFLTLAERAADANGIREESEENLLIAYADEMGIDVSIEDIPTEDIYARLLKISNPVEINQMTFELVGLLLSDGEYDSDEKQFVDKLSVGLKVPKERIEKMFDLVGQYSGLIKSINRIMFDV